jgi:bisphosphoglycerate-independent phosphoglycerate mutase (AlkP superfamily)
MRICVHLDNDTLIFFDYRADRMREISETFGLERHFETEVKHPSGLVSARVFYYQRFLNVSTP